MKISKIKSEGCGAKKNITGNQKAEMKINFARP